MTTCHTYGGEPEHILKVEKIDYLVRLNIGAIPEESGISDWMLLTGDMLYLLARRSGEVSYLHVPLDLKLLESVRESAVRDEGGIYRDSRGEPTPLATYLALFFLQRNVPLQAIRRELDMSEATINRLLDVRHLAGGIDLDSRLPLTRRPTFERKGTCPACRIVGSANSESSARDGGEMR
ncbi:hypothetical protein AWB82_04638 [Caballeronia glebae]|uniref:Uncharacterized protein n=1 Tax=Caballeronia glebae TaxID=1777143 RepID=A0A158BVY5_9BURK|nr:hypothetical protein AWB82_04638 [Caballeronia glebae]